MTPLLRVFYAQPVDDTPEEQIKNGVERFANLLVGLPVEILTPYLEEERNNQSATITRALAQVIVSKDYEAVDACDLLVVDLSQHDRQAVGMIFEMAYARQQGKCILVYTAGS